jgi:hypothetical protein
MLKLTASACYGVIKGPHRYASHRCTNPVVVTRIKIRATLRKATREDEVIQRHSVWGYERRKRAWKMMMTMNKFIMMGALELLL